MKKVIVFLLFIFLLFDVSARDKIPKYKIISNSNSQNDIKEMYAVKNNLIKDYKIWSKSVDDIDQVLYDHQYLYNAVYDKGIYLIILGEGKGKELTGELKANYCESTKDIQKKSLLFGWLFS